MQRALAAWRTPEAAAEIAAKLMNWEVPVKNYDCLRAAL
jgi:hypothetical protein